MASLKIIDVSSYQGTIDWKKVKKEVDGVIIRCGWGKNIEKQDDKHYENNVLGCIANDIPFGVYLYSYAKTNARAKSEAEHVLRLVEPYKNSITLPVYLDLEEKGTEKGAVERAKIFANILEEKGYSVGIYANQYWWRTYLKDGLDKYTKWVAKYSTEEPTGISGNFDIWQYTSSGTVNGIQGRVDMNICYKDFKHLSELKKDGIKVSDLKRGSKGELVTLLQMFLKTINLYNDSIDGSFGPNTEKAVIAWNNQCGRFNNKEWTVENWQEAFPY